MSCGHTGTDGPAEAEARKASEDLARTHAEASKVAEDRLRAETEARKAAEEKLRALEEELQRLRGQASDSEKAP